MTNTIPHVPDKGEVTGEMIAGIVAHTGLPAADIKSLVEKAGLAALVEHYSVHEEITVPLSLVVIPAGKLPVFLDERTVRYMRKCAQICNVDADEWVEGWIGTAQVDDGLCGRNDVNFGGITHDMVENHHSADEEARSEQEKEEMYEELREVAFRYQREVASEGEEEVAP